MLLVSPAAPVVQDGVDVSSELSARQVKQLQEVRGHVELGLLELQVQGVPGVDSPVLALQFRVILQVPGEELRGEPRVFLLQAAYLVLQVDEVPFHGGDLHRRESLPDVQDLLQHCLVHVLLKMKDLASSYLNLFMSRV